nr:MAG TPA: hypothetical protein [Bacteriophage sp.]DAV84331.1 MAG TPA: hypothetical protein [Bacteriophage sp.]
MSIIGVSLFAHADFYAINICVSKNVNRKQIQRIIICARFVR